MLACLAGGVMAAGPGLVISDVAIADLHTATTEEVLSQCIYRGGDPERRAAAMAFYDIAGNRLIGAWLGGELVGVVGLCPQGSAVEIRHLAVDARHRQCGIGRQLLIYCQSIYPGKTLIAETDREAKEFYRKCGFTCRSMGEKYPGTERFECTHCG
jgi:ribosomal protein S18 acetylase RimI-like enzyme